MLAAKLVWDKKAVVRLFKLGTLDWTTVCLVLFMFVVQNDFSVAPTVNFTVI